MAKAARTQSSRRGSEAAWSRLRDEALLDWRICDLKLRIPGTPLESRIERVREELSSRGLKLRPHFWLSSEWFTPDNVPGVAIPFYLAHPRLMRLEERQMLEVEGGTAKWCLKLLRHELGHAIDNAFRLRRKRCWQRVFGQASQRYPDYYQPRPYSKRFVLHLDYWYAQSHPTEDFAESFAVWLTPGLNWRKRYRGWPALKKLEYVDELMTSLRGKTPPVRTRVQDEPVGSIRTTLREHYRRKREHYGVAYPDFYDRDLHRLFADDGSGERGVPAATFLRRIRREIRRHVARWTGLYQYTIDQVLQEMIDRCQELGLRARGPEERLKLEAALMLGVQTMNHLHGGHHRLAV